MISKPTAIGSIALIVFCIIGCYESNEPSGDGGSRFSTSCYDGCAESPDSSDRSSSLNNVSEDSGIQDAVSTDTRTPAYRSPVYIDEYELVMQEGFPVVVKLKIAGNLPDLCKQLRSRVSPPDEENRIQVTVYSFQRSPDMICALALQPFETVVNLGEFTEGAFSVWVNGERIAAFEIP